MEGQNRAQGVVDQESGNSRQPSFSGQAQVPYGYARTVAQEALRWHTHTIPHTGTDAGVHIPNQLIPHSPQGNTNNTKQLGGAAYTSDSVTSTSNLPIPPTSYAIPSTPFTLIPVSYTSDPNPPTLYSIPPTTYSVPSTPNSGLYTSDPKPSTSYPIPSTSYSIPSASNPISVPDLTTQARRLPKCETRKDRGLMNWNCPTCDKRPINKPDYFESQTSNKPSYLEGPPPPKRQDRHLHWAGVVMGSNDSETRDHQVGGWLPDRYHWSDILNGLNVEVKRRRSQSRKETPACSPSHLLLTSSYCTKTSTG